MASNSGQVIYIMVFFDKIKHKKTAYGVVAVLSLLFIATVVVVSRPEKVERGAMQDDPEKCLQDADCRSRLEAAVNQVYSESGYDGVYTAP